MRENEKEYTDNLTTSMFYLSRFLESFLDLLSIHWDHDCEYMRASNTVKNNLFIGNFYVFFPCRIYLKTLVLPLTH